ncbi:MAG: hypothetical protein EPO16_03315 [Dehalococcoidia bacterium]|nr:MAG: hypothetical protein EPO16_03315 [Dehalococcoidia bacterium]
MRRRAWVTLAGFVAVIAAGAAFGVASAPRGAARPVPSVSPSASFTPGFIASPTALATFTPGPEPTAITGATPTERLPLVRFTPTGSPFAMAVLPVEVPPTSEYGIGLSGRRSLEGRGMVFYYPDGKGNAGFWMKDTHIDLDIAFVDLSMKVVAVMQMKADTETVHRPSVPYLAAIEAPSGYYAAAGVKEGATVAFLFDIANTVQR